MNTIQIGKNIVELKTLTPKQAQQEIDNNIKWHDLTIEKNYRKLTNIVKLEDEKIYNYKNQKPVKEITIAIDWIKSSTWGMNPHASAQVSFQDGTFYYDTLDYTAGGCGYDKESTVIASIFNAYLRYELYKKEGKENANKPYGIRLAFGYILHFEGGVGTSCYYSISDFIGGKFEHVASTKKSDVYKFTMEVE